MGWEDGFLDTFSVMVEWLEGQVTGVAGRLGRGLNVGWDCGLRICSIPQSQFHGSRENLNTTTNQIKSLCSQKQLNMFLGPVLLVFIAAQTLQSGLAYLIILSAICRSACLVASAFGVITQARRSYRAKSFVTFLSLADCLKASFYLNYPLALVLWPTLTLPFIDFWVSRSYNVGKLGLGNGRTEM